MKSIFRDAYKQTKLPGVISLVPYINYLLVFIISSIALFPIASIAGDEDKFVGEWVLDNFNRPQKQMCCGMKEFVTIKKRGGYYNIESSGRSLRNFPERCFDRATFEYKNKCLVWNMMGMMGATACFDGDTLVFDTGCEFRYKRKK